MILKYLNRLLMILVVVCIVGLLLFLVVDKMWNDPGDPPVVITPTEAHPPVTRTPRGDEPIPREDPTDRQANGGASMPELLIGGVPLVALIVALVELAKQTMGLDSQYAPVTAVVLGILIAIGIQVSTLFPEFGTWFQVVVLGMVAGLLACGIYSGTKATMGGR